MENHIFLRIISLLLVALTLFSLAACSPKTNTDPIESSKTTETDGATEQTTDSTEKSDPDEDKKGDKQENEDKEEERLPEAPAAVFGTPVPTVKYSTPPFPRMLVRLSTFQSTP